MHESLRKLIDGNKRFANGKSIHPNLGNELRNALVDGQRPFAAILSCSDSRVPVEIIFDVGLGDLFIVRTAGHVLSKEVMGSIEYAVKELNTKLVMILGHDNCGAIRSAIDSHKNNKYSELSENLQSILNPVYPVLDELKNKKNINLLKEAIEANIHYQVQDLLKKDACIAQKVKEGEVILVGAKYNLETGIVEILDKYVKQ